MRIAGLVATAHRIPLARPMVSAKYRITHRELVVVRVETDAGHTGTGWCMVNMGALSIQALIRSYLAPMLAGENPLDVERHWDRLWESCHFLGPGGVSTYAIGAIDIALWDIRAQAAGMPLWRLLGGARDTVPVYASAINLHLSDAELMDQTEGYLSQGYSTFKMKIGRPNPEEDIARVGAMRALIGPARTLLLDANQKWKAAEAADMCQRFRAFRPGWMEEPVSSDDIAGNAFARAHGGIPIALGEQLCNRFEFWNYVRADAADVLQPNVWKVGGVTEWMKIAHMVQHANLPISPHDSWELALHLVAAIPNGWAVENLLNGSLCDLGLVQRPIPVANGLVRMDARPGHGVELDEAALARVEVAPGTVLDGGPAVRRPDDPAA